MCKEIFAVGGGGGETHTHVRIITMILWQELYVIQYSSYIFGSQ